jgi:hypothetical protein
MGIYAVLLACPSSLWPIVDLVVLLLFVVGRCSLSRCRGAERLAALTAARAVRAFGKNRRKGGGE